MKAIIFGINGQDGFYLDRLLSQNNIEVIGVSRTVGSQWINGNITDAAFVEALIQTHQPDYIFNFAANSTTRHDSLMENHETISTGTLHILESVFKYSKQTKVFLSGSAVQFENNGTPINETTPFAALSPYAVSRIHTVYAGRYYRSLGVPVYVGYFFNHDSPLRTERHINQKIAKAVQRIAAGSEEKIVIGNTAVQKEFNYAADMMQAIWCLVKQDKIFEAVIGSGKAYTIQTWIEKCFRIIGKAPDNYIQIEKDFTAEYEILVSDPALLFSLGYKPAVDIDMLVEMMIKN